MNFQQAMSIMGDGGRVTRRGWPPKKKLFMAKNPEDLGLPKGTLPIAYPHLNFPMIVEEDGSGGFHCHWTPDQNELFGRDWEKA